MKSTLITGAGTGIGKDAAKALPACGHTVFATTYAEREVAGLQAELGPGAHVFKLDITKPEDRAQIADLDVLLNNAVQSQSGSLAEVDADRMRRLFEGRHLPHDRARGRHCPVHELHHGPGATSLPDALLDDEVRRLGGRRRTAREIDVLAKGVRVTVTELGPYDTGFNRKLSDSRFEWMEQGSLFTKEQRRHAGAASPKRMKYWRRRRGGGFSNWTS